MSDDYGRLVRLFERECPNCKSYRPGRKSDCEIRKALLYKMPTNRNMLDWFSSQVFNGGCKQRRVK